jgi:teneurin
LLSYVGLAIAADKTMYIADGTNIRAVDPKGLIHTIVGHHGHHNHWSPAPCIGAIPAHQAQLQWPTGLSLSPLDGALHFIDDRLVMKLTPDMKVKVVAGTPLHCRSNALDSNDEFSDRLNSTLKRETKVGSVLGTILSLSFAPTGELYIAEADARRVNLIKCIDTSGKITLFAGKQNDKIKDVTCECNSSSPTTNNPQLHKNSDQMSCPCISNIFMEEATSNAETLLSSNARFEAISALSVSPDGVLNIADQSMYRIT